MYIYVCASIYKYIYKDENILTYITCIQIYTNKYNISLSLYIYTYMRQVSGLQAPPTPWYPPPGEGSGFLWFSMFSLSFLIVFLWCACWWSLSLAGCIEHVGKPYENIRKPLENHTKPTTHHHRGGGIHLH